VQRWLKFVKYLPGFGWEPYVFTPQNPAYTITDETLSRDVPPEAKVIRFPIWEPYGAYNKVNSALGGNVPAHDVSTKKRSWFRTISTWLRGNMIVPDPRVFWVRPSVKFLTTFLTDNNIDVVITTGPPHSMHLIGLALKKRLPSLKWIADFRDPWSQWGLLDSLSVSRPVRRVHERLERRVLQSADVVTSITPFYVRQFATIGKREVLLLTNGYDEDDFRDFHVRRASKFFIRHIGIVNEKCDPRGFMKAVAAIVKEDPVFAADVAVEFIGEVNVGFRNHVNSDQVLTTLTTFIPGVPHRELLSMYESSALLVLVLVGYKDAEGYMPGKMFEYIATGIPVVGVGPVDGDAAALLRDSGAGTMVDGNDDAGIRARIKSVYGNWKNGQIIQTGSLVTGYSRKAVTKKLVALLENLNVSQH
jgi:glycosyltransferase involved in cell wall biosynthesis